MTEEEMRIALVEADAERTALVRQQIAMQREQAALVRGMLDMFRTQFAPAQDQAEAEVERHRHFRNLCAMNCLPAFVAQGMNSEKAAQHAYIYADAMISEAAK